ncbi:hypothetical protein TwortDSMZ_027 [Staphylococcus phage Twort]|uniref:Uncharacterized protein n=2 Tax=Staphylococcus phage Twort (strain DSM 17442 / HER 48) TaxID=2908167 RepID=A0A6H0X544_BPTWO|nr:ORF126 [Staphylococcus phage Twort]AAX92415.1 ORF126 [Staphylococcus phage Twort]QIW89036.1 hypothetical protein TwortDSMZ_027 [Staphylococcus phage Twort]
MNKEQAKLKLKTDIINYENQIKFLDPSSMYTRWLIDAKIYAEMALNNLEETGEHNYKDVEWEEEYTKIFTDKEILEFILSSKNPALKKKYENYLKEGREDC